MTTEEQRRESAPRAAPESIDIAIIGGGPAGLAAAESAALTLAGRRTPGPALPGRIAVFEAMPSLGRKLLMAGKSGLNITFDAPSDRLIAAYRRSSPALEQAVRAFGPAEIRAWMDGLGAPSFVGTSGRVFPEAMKASPLLRAWLRRLSGLGVETRPRWRWRRITAQGLDFETPRGVRRVAARVCVLAMGGASWPRLGSTGAWTAELARLGAPIAPFAPSNVGWSAGLSPFFLERFAGAPLKTIAAAAGGARVRGALMITRYGFEGAPLYALTPPLSAGAALALDLAPDRRRDALIAALGKPRGKASFSSWMRKAARLGPAETALLREAGAPPSEPEALAARIKACPVPLTGPRPIEEAISTAGGLAWEGVGPDLALRAHPTVFAAGEMLEWDAPTGGYLLTACLALGRRAGAAAAERLIEQDAG
ncbi:MAG: TIGR03862 family flavoprotein [Pseudomonadota bacterium]